MSLLEKLVAEHATVADPQSKSVFFKLPPEARTEIYQYVYPKNILHFRKTFHAAEHNEPYCRANWCVAIDDHKQGHTHAICEWFEKPRKHLLGMPLSCRRLYSETIQKIYGSHTMQFNDESFLLEWQGRTPRIHVDAITSVRLYGLAVTPQPQGMYNTAWEMLSLLPNLENLAVRIRGGRGAYDFEPHMQEEMSAPMKKIQQSTIKSFDVILNIEDTWFLDDYYLRIEYNGLRWKTFSLDKHKFPLLFDGMHPRCRVVGMQCFILDLPVRDDMPTMEHLYNWMSWFSCNPAFYSEDRDPPEYDWEEVGERFATAKAFADKNPEHEERLQKQIGDERAELERKYLAGGEGPNADPVNWDLIALNRVAELSDLGRNRWPRFGRWCYPEKPSWIKDGSLEKRNELLPSQDKYPITRMTNPIAGPAEVRNNAVD